MLGFSFPKILLLFIILFLVWNFFKLIEKKVKKSNVAEAEKDNINNNYGEALTECHECGGFYSTAKKGKCPICVKKNEIRTKT